MTLADYQPDFREANERISQWVDKGYYEGATFIVMRDGQILHEMNFGNFDRHTNIRIASMTKWLEAATLMTIVDQGLIKLDDPISKYLPQFDSNKSFATIGQCFAHTSGIGSIHGHLPEDQTNSIAHRVNQLAKLSMPDDPGKRFEYNGNAINVAGRIVEIVTGKSWELVFAENIAKPCKMYKTYTGMNWWYVGKRLKDDPFPTSNATDYLHFLEMLNNRGMYRGKRVLSENAIQIMQADHVGTALMEHDFIRRTRNREHTSVYGLGQWRENIDDNNNALRVSSPSYLGSYPWIDLGNNIYGVFMGKANEKAMHRDKFSGFYASPILSDIAAKAIHAYDLTGGAYDFSPLHQMIEQWVNTGSLPGANLMIVCKDRLVVNQSYGCYSADMPVYIASAGKWLATATIAAVVDEGKLSWDDPVSQWLPQLGEEKGKATLRQLLSHTSGYPTYQPKNKPRDTYQTLALSVEHLKALPMVCKPGQRFDYGGLAMQVAGRMAELASGKDWPTLFNERIAKPLGMASTRFTPVDSGPGHAPMLGGGAASTVQDYMNFLNMIAHDGVFNGKRILSKEAVQQLHADQMRHANTQEETFLRTIRSAHHHGIYGLGVWREEVDATNHATLLSSPSWAGAYPWIDRQTQTYGFFLTHVDTRVASRHRFNAFTTTPDIAPLVRKIVTQSQTTHK